MSQTTPLVPKRKRALEILTIEEPCEEPWDGMRDLGDGRRHCAMCMQDVFDLSRMTREAAEALVFEDSKRVCVRFFRRSDGTVVTSDCTPIRHRALRKAAGGALRLGARFVAACLTLLAAAGVARAQGFDVFRWIRSTDVGKGLLFEEMPMAGAPLMMEPEEMEPEEAQMITEDVLVPAELETVDEGEATR